VPEPRASGGEASFSGAAGPVLFRPWLGPEGLPDKALGLRVRRAADAARETDPQVAKVLDQLSGAIRSRDEQARVVDVTGLHEKVLAGVRRQLELAVDLDIAAASTRARLIHLLCAWDSFTRSR
jgi:hypothetical protein